MNIICVRESSWNGSRALSESGKGQGLAETINIFFFLEAHNCEKRLKLTKYSNCECNWIQTRHREVNGTIC